MAELTIRPEEIRDALAHFVQEYEPEGASREEVGTVIECGDGIARVEGLPSAMANELLEFENGVRGLALNLDVREIGVVILGEFNVDTLREVRVDKDNKIFKINRFLDCGARWPLTYSHRYMPASGFAAKKLSPYVSR